MPCPHHQMPFVAPLLPENPHDPAIVLDQVIIGFYGVARLIKQDDCLDFGILNRNFLAGRLPHPVRDAGLGQRSGQDESEA